MDFFLVVTYFFEKKWGVGYITSVGIFFLIVLPYFYGTGSSGARLFLH